MRALEDEARMITFEYCIGSTLKFVRLLVLGFGSGFCKVYTPSDDKPCLQSVQAGTENARGCTTNKTIVKIDAVYLWNVDLSQYQQAPTYLEIEMTANNETTPVCWLRR